MDDLLKKIEQLEIENSLLKNRLHEGERKYRTFFNNSSDPMTILDGKVFIAVNQQVLNLLQYDSKEEFLNKEPHVFSPKFQLDGRLSSEKQNEMIEIALEKGTHVFEWVHKKKNGDVFPVEISLIMIEEEEKKIIHVIWRDLTISKEKEEALKVSEKNYKQIVEQNPFSILVHKQGKVVYCNKSLLELHGVKNINDAIGLNVIDFVHPDFREIVINRMKKVHNSDYVAPKLEERLIKYNGEEYFAEVTSMSIEFEKEPATMIIINDITEKKITEDMIIKEKVKYHDLIDNLNEGVLEVDKEENITYANEVFAKIVNYSVDELLTMKLTDLVSEADYMEVINQSRLRKTGISSKYRINLITSDKKEKQILLTASTKFDDNNNYTGSTGIFYDFTELEDIGLKIKEVEQINKAVINSSPIGISVRDKNGTLLLHNNSWKRIWGLSDEEVRDYYNPKGSLEFDENDDYLNDLDADIKKVYTSGGEFLIPEIKTVKRKNKNIEWVSQYFYAIENEENKVDKVVIFTIDITEKKRNEKLVKDSEEKYKRIYENSITPIYTFDKNKRFVDSNPAGLEVLGYSLEELLKLSISDVDADSKVVLPAHKRLLEGKSLRNFEHNLRKKNGETVTVLNNSIPIKDSSDNLIGIQSVLMDITDKAEFDEKLLKLASVIEQSSESIVITDLDGLIQYVNPAFEKITGYTLEEAIGKNPNILKTGEQELQVYKDLWQTITEKKIWYGIFSNKKKDGTFFYERATIFPILDEKNRIISYAAIKHDITKERKLEEQLQQSQKMESIGILAGGVAHDFNNLLTVINGRCQIGQTKIIDNPEGAFNDFSEIYSAGQKATTLVRQLLGFSRKQPIKPKVLSLNSLIANLEKMLKRLISEDIEIKLSLTSGIKDIKADPGQIEQILINLVVNARDAIVQRKKTDFGSPKKIVIETNESRGAETSYFEDEAINGSRDYVVFSVTDTGIGIDTDTKKKIFDPFFTTKEEGKGTGLGLAMIYGVVKQNKAEISVYSELNKGTTFSIYWPGVEEDLTIDEADEDIFSELIGSGTVLIVEDDELIRNFASETLSSVGYNIIEAENGEKAYRLLINKETPKIDLILTDVVMPKMDGKELVKKALALNPELRILFTSGYTKEYLTEDDFPVDEYEFMDKPYSITELAKRVQGVLKK